MKALSSCLQDLNDLLEDIQKFITIHLEDCVYKAPIIDQSLPDGYRQTTVTGLRKFLGTVENEKSYVEGLANSTKVPKEYNTNAPHLIAVWEQLIRADWPILCVSQFIDCGSESPVKIDVVAKGGDEWIKVNTMKESRLLAEFREQDSYINSDYDSDSSVDRDMKNGKTSMNGKGGRELSDGHDHDGYLTNSLIDQATTLIRASRHHLRPLSLPAPKITLVANRLEEVNNGDADDRDPRIEATFRQIRDMGVNLVIGSPMQSSTSFETRKSISLGKGTLAPTAHIMLDLSVIIALCCDSTHHPLPSSPYELEARFRPLNRSAPIDETENHKETQLQPHSNVTKDLRDQLDKEIERPLIAELKATLESFHSADLKFWVTKEVRNKLPTLVDVIGGPREKSRSKALFGGGGDFWSGSRWAGDEGVLRSLRVWVLDDEWEESTVVNVNDIGNRTFFQQGLVTTCSSMLATSASESDRSTSSTRPSTPSRSPIESLKPQPPIKQLESQNQNLKRGKRRSQPTTKVPSGHTLRTVIEGASRGWTVLTNNRGAVGKIIREMGVSEGLPWVRESGAESGNENGHRDGGESCSGRGGKERAAIWVVNPSSLSEWRRLDVERENASQSSLGPTLMPTITARPWREANFPE